MSERAIYHEGEDIGHVYRQDDLLFPWAVVVHGSVYGWCSTYEGAVAWLMQMWAQSADMKNRTVPA